MELHCCSFRSGRWSAGLLGLGRPLVQEVVDPVPMGGAGAVGLVASGSINGRGVDGGRLAGWWRLASGPIAASDGAATGGVGGAVDQRCGPAGSGWPARVVR